MIQRDIYREIAETQGIMYKTARLLVQTFFATITKAILEGRPVEIRGLGSWRLRRREPFLHTNPRTLKKTLRTGYKVRYRPGKKLNRQLTELRKMRSSAESTQH